MGLFSRYFLKQHDEFANKLAREFIENCPLTLINVTQNRKAVRKLDKTVNNLYAQAKDYRCKVKLNIYTKARIGNKFMWALRDAGYSEILIEELTNGILHALGSK
jgi:hypothetical protein